jgi:hypothetical protein
MVDAAAASTMVVRAAALAVVIAAVLLPGAEARPSAWAYLYLKTTGLYGAVDLYPSGTQTRDCTTYCTFAFPAGSTVTLAAEPGAGRFLQWSPWATNIGSLCAGTSPRCVITLDNSTAIKAVFNPVSLRLTWTDGGYVTLDNPGPSCGRSCYLYDVGARAEIHAHSVGDNEFSSWGGGCGGAGPDCGVLMSDNRVLGASFRCTGTVCSTTEPLSTTLDFWVKVIGGSVSGSLSCSGSCYKSVNVGQQLTLQSSSNRVQWQSRYFTCRSGSTRCMFRVGTNSSSSRPLVTVTFS